MCPEAICKALPKILPRFNKWAAILELYQSVKWKNCIGYPVVFPPR